MPPNEQDHNMSKSLHLLMAEDSASDALLILEELRRGDAAEFLVREEGDDEAHDRQRRGESGESWSESTRRGDHEEGEGRR